MGSTTGIEWTQATWTPIRARYSQPTDGKERIGWHCEHVSEGCRFCYAETLNGRIGTGRLFRPDEYRNGDVQVFLDEKMLQAPSHWHKPKQIFVCSMTDLFAQFVKDEWIDAVFQKMDATNHHTFQVLTKRPERMREYVTAYGGSIMGGGPLPHVWLGVSVEDQKAADERIPHLLQTPAAVRFLSVEPMLGPIDLRHHLMRWGNPIGWVICGAESGPAARPMELEWARSLRDQCAEAGVRFFMKQLSGPNGRAIKDMAAFPPDLRVREMP